MIFDAPNTKRNRIAAGIAIALGLGVGFYLSVSDKGDEKVKVEDAIGVPIVPKTPFSSPDTALLPAGTVDDIDFNAYSVELASHIGLIEGETRLDAIDKIRLYFAPEPGTNMVNLTSSTFELDDGSVMLFARNNLPDDSVFAEEVYAVFSGPGEAKKFNQSLAAYGLRIKCRRGENAMEWTTDLCP